MDDLSKEYLISFYSRTLEMYGDRPEALRWTAHGQIRHYESLLDIAESIHDKKILDFGCGKGDFFSFLKERSISVNYTGLDINDNLIALAKQKHPECRFGVLDIEKDTLDEEFDYIFLCGVFNLNFQGIDEAIRTTLKELFPLCKKALAFNALSDHTPRKDFALHYVSPEELFHFAVKHLSPFVALRHDRMLYDFTLFVYREMNDFP